MFKSFPLGHTSKTKENPVEQFWMLQNKQCLKIKLKKRLSLILDKHLYDMHLNIPPHHQFSNHLLSLSIHQNPIHAYETMWICIFCHLSPGGINDPVNYLKFSSLG